MSDTLYRQLGMTDEEYSSVCEILGRTPSNPELAMYSVMWSEHCSYKSSRKHLGQFPTEATWVVVGPGENAGVVDLGNGWLAALRIESHNHPAFVEPYQGAATGVGGILRDVFTMGARPIALWDQIRFGSLNEAHNRYLFSGVVSGIAGYGNAVGVPTVGGEVEFDDCYAGNPLVNVMCLGVLKREQLVLGTAGSAGMIAILLGSATGRDGIGGASVLASASFNEDSGTKRPSVQVGNPFEEKKLIEACLELYERNLCVGVQDLGAAGLSCATSEPAARAGMGIDFDLDTVHVREADMTATELLISESQERMMAFVTPDKVADVLAVANKWEIDASVVGTVKEGGALRVFHEGALIAEIPAASLTENAPLLDRPSSRPEWLDDLWAMDPPPPTTDVAGDLLRLLDDPSVADPAWIYQQYDHQLFLNTAVGPGNDGSLLRIKGTTKGLAVSTDGNGRLCYLDPRNGSARLVYEAALNVALTSARGLAVVDNLNFGNPEHPYTMWQFIESIKGISLACEALGVPVVGGNVSFYNRTDDQDIHPTPIVGYLGMADPMPTHLPRLNQAEAGMELWAFGPDSDNLSGSTYAKVVHQHLGGRPDRADEKMAIAVIDLAATIAERELSPALHDISDGGIAVAISEICIQSGVGVKTKLLSAPFSEPPHRFLAVLAPEKASEVAKLAKERSVPVARLGVFGGDTIELGPAAVTLVDGTTTYRSAIPRRMA